MQMLFVDESGTPPKPDKIANAPFFVLGGCIIPENYWHQVKSDFDHLKKRFNIVGEVKWRYFAPPREGAKEHH
jgi:hypothetical protein